MINSFLTYGDLIFPSSRATSTVKDGVTTVNYPIPGYGKEDISVQVVSDTLLIQARGRDLASYTLYDADVNNIKASVKNGLLTINVAKKSPVIIPITEE